jgi:Uma2 family endonuclease
MSIHEPFSVADLLHKLGGIPAKRVRLNPPPGTATEKDVIAAEHEPRKALCELIDGTLVEKPMGLEESMIAMQIGHLILAFLEKNNLDGIVTGESGFLRLAPGSVRIPDVSYINEEQLRSVSKLPSIGDFAPDLAVEVISKSNTRREMALKRQQYFDAGTRLVWEVHPTTRSVDVYTSPSDKTTMSGNNKLTGGDVLPGFSTNVQSIFGKRR